MQNGVWKMVSKSRSENGRKNNIGRPKVKEGGPKWTTRGETKTGSQTDNLKPLCDWLTTAQLVSDWLSSPSSKHQFDNPSRNPNLFGTIFAEHKVGTENKFGAEHSSSQPF